MRHQIGRPCPTVFVLTLAALLLAVPSLAQDASDCAKCKTSEGPWNTHHSDQTACPGADKVVCDLRYTKVYKAECEAGHPIIRNCKPAERDKDYPATAFPAGTCGTVTRDAKGNVVSSTCGALAANPTTTVKDKEAYCTGVPWLDAITIALADRYNVSITVANGTNVLANNGVSTLGSTVISIPAGFVRDAIEEGFLAPDGDTVQLEVVLGIRQPGRFSLPGQDVPVVVAEGNPEVLSARLEDGSVHVVLAIPLVNMGAFDSYGIDVAGLQVTSTSSPTAGTASEPAPGLVSEEPTLIALVQVGSVDGERLVGGAGVIGRTVGDLRPQPVLAVPIQSGVLISD
ncbi:MAG TPA: hypothetical protein VF017_11870 [Thermoanaerobaculia bacterium]|nr:hypothetical protein [Thermoanaerobaculia bacterium]